MQTQSGGVSDPRLLQAFYFIASECSTRHAISAFRDNKVKKTCGEKQAPIILTSFAALRSRTFSVAYNLMLLKGWLGSRVVCVLDSGAEGPGFKSQSRRCRVTVSGKLFTPVVPLFTKQRNW